MGGYAVSVRGGSDQGRTDRWVRWLILVAAVGLVGCTNAQNNPDPAETTTAPALLMRVPLTYPSPPATVDIGWEGIISIDAESSCVTLTEQTPEERVRAVAFSEVLEPSIDMTDPASPVLMVDGCRPIESGDLVTFRGMGLVDRTTLSDFIDSADLQRCDTTIDDLDLIGFCDGRSRP